jgi:hypothetical protein
MLKEEITTVTISTFITRDGTKFTSAGPQDHQIKAARQDATEHDVLYDFYNFEVDPTITIYTPANWVHFKWTLLRKQYLQVKKWRNGYHFQPFDYGDWMNTLTPDEYRHRLLTALFDHEHRTEYGIPTHYHSDTWFQHFLFQSGFLDWPTIQAQYTPAVISEKIFRCFWDNLDSSLLRAVVTQKW